MGNNNSSAIQWAQGSNMQAYISAHHQIWTHADRTSIQIDWFLKKVKGYAIWSDCIDVAYA